MVDTFTRVPWRKRGYSPQQVDAFLEKAKAAYSPVQKDPEIDVMSTGFKLVRAGYTPEAVDGALERLHVAFVHRKRAHSLASAGEKEWLDSTYEAAKTLYPRLKRKRGERFANARGRGYEKVAVDTFLEQVGEYFSGERELTANDVRAAVFPRARNKKGYDEAVVDAYLDRVIDVLLAVE